MKDLHIISPVGGNMGNAGNGYTRICTEFTECVGIAGNKEGISGAKGVWRVVSTGIIGHVCEK